jgi:hypothetical protein
MALAVDIAVDAKAKICQIVCKHRWLNDRTMRLFLGPDEEYLALQDCAGTTLAVFPRERNAVYAGRIRQ